MQDAPVQNFSRKIKTSPGVFASEKVRMKMDSELMVYQVQLFLPVPEGAHTIYPGRVDQDYFMTKGHFHAIRDRGEYYWCIEGMTFNTFQHTEMVIVSGGVDAERRHNFHFVSKPYLQENLWQKFIP